MGTYPTNNESSAQDNGEGSEHQSQDCAHHMACGLHPIILSLHSICRRDALTNKCANRDVKSTASGACCNMMNLLRGRIPLVRYASFSSGTCAACMDEHARIVEDRMLRCRIDRTAFCCCCILVESSTQFHREPSPVNNQHEFEAGGLKKWLGTSLASYTVFEDDRNWTELSQEVFP